MWYHATSYEELEQIKKVGFIIGKKKHGRRYGHGVYFFDTPTEAAFYGRVIVCSTVLNEKILYTNCKEWGVVEDTIIFKNNDPIQFMTDYVKRQGYRGLCIEYPDKVKELVVYEPSIIRFQKEMDAGLFKSKVTC